MGGGSSRWGWWWWWWCGRVVKRVAPRRGPVWGSNRSVGDAARRFRYLREQTRAMAAMPVRSEAGRGGDGASHGSGRERDLERKKKDFWEYDTAGSRVITDLSTNAACWCLTSQIGRDVVFSPKYGRTQQTARGPLEVVWWRGAGPFPGAETGKKKLAPFGACSKDFRFVRPESFSYQ